MFFHIAFKDLKIIFKDRKALAVMLVMPALIMLILGSSLGSSFSIDLKVQKFAVGVVNKDRGIMSQVFINKVLRENLSDLFETFVVEEDEANSMLKKNTVPSVIIIPEGFTRNIEANKPVRMEVKTQLFGQFQGSIVKTVAEGFAESTSVNYAGAFAVADTMDQYKIPFPAAAGGVSKATMIMSELQKDIEGELVKFTEVNEEKKRNLSGIQYYSAAMLVMFMLFGSNYGTKLMVEERESRTLGRLMSTRVSRVTLITGKFLGLFLICLTQSLILMVFTRLVYGVHWGNSLPGLALVTLCAVFAGAALGMLIASLAKTVKAADGIGQLFIQTFTIIGGGMIPIYVMPESIRFMANFTLNWWAMKGYNDLMMGMGVTAVLPYCGILALMGAAYLTLGVWRFKVE
jgi:ABC-2 type transport system permease protein